MKMHPEEIFRKLKKEPVNREFLKTLREDLIHYVETNPVYGAPENGKSTGLRFRLASILAALAMLSAAAGTVFASEQSLPGSILYPVKLAAEKVRLAATLNPQARTDLRIKFAGERIAEIKKIVSENPPTSSGKAGIINEPLDNLAAELDSVLGYVGNLKKRGEEENALENSQYLQSAVELYKKSLEREKENKYVAENVVPVLDGIQNKINENLAAIRKESSPPVPGKLEQDTEIKINRARERIGEIKSNLKTESDNEAAQAARAKLDDAERALEYAQNNFASSEYASSSLNIGDSQKFSAEAKALIEIGPTLGIGKENHGSEEKTDKVNETSSTDKISPRIDNENRGLDNYNRDSHNSSGNDSENHRGDNTQNAD